MSKKVLKPKSALPSVDLTPYRREVDAFPLIGLISNDSQFETARDRYKVLRKLESRVDTVKDSIIGPIKESIKATNALFKPVEQSIDVVIEEYTTELTRYANAKEIARLQELARIENDKRIKKVETIQAAKEAVGERLGGTMRVTKLVIESPGKVPVKYWVIDEAAVKKALQQGIEVPGAKLVEELTVTAR